MKDFSSHFLNLDSLRTDVAELGTLLASSTTLPER